MSPDHWHCSVRALQHAPFLRWRVVSSSARASTWPNLPGRGVLDGNIAVRSGRGTPFFPPFLSLEDPDPPPSAAVG